MQKRLKNQKLLDSIYEIFRVWPPSGRLGLLRSCCVGVIGPISRIGLIGLILVGEGAYVIHGESLQTRTDGYGLTGPNLACARQDPVI